MFQFSSIWNSLYDYYFKIIFLKKLYHQFFKIHHNVSHLAPPPRYVAQKFDNKHSTNAKYILAKIYARSSNPYSIRVKDTFSLFPSFLFFFVSPTMWQSKETLPLYSLESSCNTTRSPSLGLSCTIHRKSRNAAKSDTRLYR